MRIHFGDLVSCVANGMENWLFTINGATRMDKRDIWEGLDGMWLLKDYLTGEIEEVPGCFIAVWGVVSNAPGLKPKEGKIVSKG